MKKYREELEYFLKDRLFMLGFVLTAIAGYGYAVMTITVGIDTLEGDRYLGSGREMLRSGRFGQYFWSRLLGYGSKNPYTSYTGDLLAVILFMLAALHLCILFRRVAGDAISKWAYLAFCCVMVSYPLTNELWDFMGANCSTRAGMLAVAVAMLLLWTQIHERFRLALMLPVVILMTIVCASYESVVVVYVFSVFAVLLLQCFYGTEQEKRVGTMIRQGMVYAGALVAGLILRFVVHRAILLLFHLEIMRGNGATQFMWGTRPPMEILLRLLRDIFQRYILNGIIYFPITELVVCGVLMAAAGIVIAVKQKKAYILFPGAGMMLSLVLFSFVQGDVSPYRTCQVFTVFTAFSVMSLLHILQKARVRGGKAITGAAFAFVLLLCVQQTSCLNYFLTLDYLRSEEEADVIRNIACDLQAKYDTEKPIIFVGQFELSDKVTEATEIPADSVRWKLYAHILAKLEGIPYEQAFAGSRRILATNVRSVLKWADGAFGSQESMAKLFAYYGFSYKPADYGKRYRKAVQYVEKHQTPDYPKKGYIVDRGKFLIVNL